MMILDRNDPASVYALMYHQLDNHHIDAIEKKRIVWHSRRGLLELDLVLTSFLDRYQDTLSDQEWALYRHILIFSDNDLLDLVNLKAELQIEDRVLQPILDKLRQFDVTRI
jgi:succinate dehydrogenase flavin-adding protein (antitoxin of CptAB toxin-antitoxin module)